MQATLISLFSTLVQRALIVNLDFFCLYISIVLIWKFPPFAFLPLLFYFWPTFFILVFASFILFAIFTPFLPIFGHFCHPLFAILPSFCTFMPVFPFSFPFVCCFLTIFDNLTDNNCQFNQFSPLFNT